MTERVSNDPWEAHKKCKSVLKVDEVAAVEKAPSAFAAADMVRSRPIPMACAIIDSMSPLGAAFVITALRAQERYDKKAKSIVDLAQILEINGLQGFVEARNEMLRLTGVLLP